MNRVKMRTIRWKVKIHKKIKRKKRRRYNWKWRNSVDDKSGFKWFGYVHKKCPVRKSALI